MSIERARYLRRIATPAEKRLWYHLRNRQIAGLKFRRQQPIGGRIVDFYCAEARLAIELDGSGHTYENTRVSDAERGEELKALGIRVLRFFNSAIFDNLDGVLNAIILAVDPKRSLWAPIDAVASKTSGVIGSDPHLNPLPSEGEETSSPARDARDGGNAHRDSLAVEQESSLVRRRIPTEAR